MAWQAPDAAGRVPRGRAARRGARKGRFLAVKAAHLTRLPLSAARRWS